MHHCPNDLKICPDPIVLSDLPFRWVKEVPGTVQCMTWKIDLSLSSTLRMISLFQRHAPFVPFGCSCTSTSWTPNMDLNWIWCNSVGSFGAQQGASLIHANGFIGIAVCALHAKTLFSFVSGHVASRMPACLVSDLTSLRWPETYVWESNFHMHKNASVLRNLAWT